MNTLERIGLEAILQNVNDAISELAAAYRSSDIPEQEKQNSFTDAMGSLGKAKIRLSKAIDEA